MPPTVRGQGPGNGGKGKTEFGTMLCLLTNLHNNHVKHFTNPNSQKRKQDQRVRNCPEIQLINARARGEVFLHQRVNIREDSVLLLQRYHTGLLLELPVTKLGAHPFLAMSPIVRGGKGSKYHALSGHVAEQLPAHEVTSKSHFQLLRPPLQNWASTPSAA